MNGKTLLLAHTFILLLAGVGIGFQFIRPAKASTTWTVNDYGPADFHTIQEAINAASDGDTIYVKAGTYYENLIVNKLNLTLIGENNETTIIDGGGRDVISIRANNTIIKRFTIQNGSTGIQMPPWSHGHYISDNIIMNNDEGINGHYDVYNITISDNIITMNKLHGIEMVLHDSIISGNTISNNGKGNFIELTAGITIGFGVYDKEIYSNNNMIIGNIIKNNYNGILSAQYSEENIFYHNTFINNTHQISLLFSNNTFEENYWGDYTGKDKNGDGIGDTPYIIGIGAKDNFPLMSPFFYWNNPIDGDINKDMKVNIRDIAIAAGAFGSYPGHERWNPIADINNDSKVNIRDIVLIAGNFGKTHS